MQTTRELGRAAGEGQRLFVGREAELARLRSGLEQFGIAVVYGLPGIGKTALVRAFAARWPDDDVVVAEDVHRARGRLPLLRGKRVLATSREVLQDDRDRFELRLGGLAEDEARLYWRALDELSGPAAGFADAWERSHGHPGLLRAAHAGRADEPRPMEKLAEGLPPPARALAEMLALTGIPLPVRSLPDREALQLLVRQLLVEVDAARGCTLVEPVREILALEAGDGAHAALVAVLEQAPLEVAVRARELGRSLRALGRFDEVQRWLLDHSIELLRGGAADRLVREIEAIPREKRLPELEVAHARALMLAPDLRRAREKLARLSRSDPEVSVSYAEVSILTANLDEAERAAQAVLQNPAARPQQRTRAHVVYGSVLGYRGDLEAASAWFDRAEAEAPDRIECGKLSLSRAFLLWQAAKDESALEPMRRGQSLLSANAPGIYRDVMGPGIAIAVLARLGRFEEAQSIVRSTEEAWRGSTSARPRLVWRALRVQLPYERGERTRALEEIASVADAFERAGDALNHWWMSVLRGRLLYALGRRNAARALLLEIGRHATAAGAKLVSAAIDWSFAQDPVEQVRRGRIPIIAAAQRGSPLEVKAHLEMLRPEPDQAVERVLGELAQAILFRGQGRLDDARACIDRAAQTAAAAGADADLVPALVDAAAATRIIAAAARDVVRGQSEPDLDRFDVVLDARTHLLRTRQRVVDLRRRPALRRLLYLLAARLGSAMSKEELAVALWSAPYDPLVHDNALRVNLRHLRQLIAAAGVSIEFADAGYRLAPPPRFAFVDEIDLSVS